MARHEQEREDLLRDAVAFVERVVFASEEYAEVFVGFRSSGAASFYFDQDPVYHFNSAGELRRGYLNGELIKARGGKLVAMRRERPGGEVQLVSRQLDTQATAQLLAQAREQLQALLDALEQETPRVVGQVPTDADVPGRVLAWLQEIVAKPLKVARSPHAR